MTDQTTSENGYGMRVAIQAPAERVFDALTTVEGLRGWWTADVTGSPAAGGEVRLGFAAVGEWFVMRVDRADRPRAVTWSCVGQQSGPPHDAEWVGTRVHFEITERSADTCELSVHHAGLTPKLACYDDCTNGWDYYAASIAGYAERGRGSPFGSRDSTVAS